MVKATRPEMNVFSALNDEEKRTGTKLPWKERYAVIQEHFPSATRLDWAEAFKDIDLFGRIIKDILRTGNTPGRNAVGPRPVLDKAEAMGRYRQLMGEDFSCEPFLVALGALAGRRSIRHLANKIGLGKHITHDLIIGRREPDLYSIEQIAHAFGKDPSYFIEWRNAYILAALGDQLDKSPETSIDLFKKLKEKNVNSNRGSKRRREGAVGDRQ